MVYKFKENTRLKLDPQVVGECLTELLESSGGSLAPSFVVEKARDTASPLHDAFEWDDKKAAEMQRLSQASYIIRNVEVVFVEGNYSGPVQAFVRNPEERNAVYVTVSRMMESDPMREKYIDNLRKEAVFCKNRLSKFEEFTAVVTAIDHVLAKVA